jgi:hypothetical protein
MEFLIFLALIILIILVVSIKNNLLVRIDELAYRIDQLKNQLSLFNTQIEREKTPLQETKKAAEEVNIVAKRWNGYGYVYAFIELGLGVCYLTGVQPVLVNVITCIVMSVSIVGVFQSVLNKQKIKCACLGDVFNLPMSTITIIEDALMILMSGLMLAFI